MSLICQVFVFISSTCEAEGVNPENEVRGAENYNRAKQD